jgi:hypothetical protein
MGSSSMINQWTSFPKLKNGLWIVKNVAKVKKIFTENLLCAGHSAIIISFEVQNRPGVVAHACNPCSGSQDGRISSSRPA